MSFWDTALGVPATPQAAPAAAPARPVLAGYAPSPYFTPSQPVEDPSEALTEPEGAQVPGQWGNVAASLQKAQSARLTDTCPECGSGNYFRPKGMPNALIQCYECGYNERFSHPSGGGGIPSDKNAPVRAARQLDSSGASNFHGQTVDPLQGGAGRIS